jgi:hypothetical protein
MPVAAFGAEGDIPIRQANGNLTSQAVSGDATITAAGVLSLATGSVGDNEIDYTAVTLADFTNDTGYFDALADFTGTLTDAYLCTYNLAGGQLVCNTAPATFEPAGVAATDITDSTAAGRTLLTAADAAAQRTALNVEDGADVTDTANVTAAGALMDSEVDADIKTLTIGASASVSGSNTGDQNLADTVAEITDLDNDAATLSLPASTTISAFGATIVDDADASAARTTLNVDAAGTDNSTDVTLAGEDFLSLTGQQITANAINPDNLASTDFGDFTCNGTNCALDSYTGTLSFATTGTLLGGLNASPKTVAAYTVGTDAATESYGTLFINGDNDAIDFTLPSAAAGMSACFVQSQGAAGAITVQPATGDYLVVDGVRGTVATDYTSSGAGADKLCVIAADATDWIVTSETGTWAE